MNFDELSFFNMVWFYREELCQVYNGAVPKDVLPRSVCSSLRKNGIFLIANKYRGRSSHKLSPRAIDVLVRDMSRSGVVLTEAQFNRS